MQNNKIGIPAIYKLLQEIKQRKILLSSESTFHNTKVYQLNYFSKPISKIIVIDER
jgi:hypothetical protein